MRIFYLSFSFHTCKLTLLLFSCSLTSIIAQTALNNLHSHTAKLVVFTIIYIYIYIYILFQLHVLITWVHILVKFLSSFFLSIYFVLTKFFTDQLQLLNRVPFSLFKIDLYSGKDRFILGYNFSLFSD